MSGRTTRRTAVKRNRSQSPDPKPTVKQTRKHIQDLVTCTLCSNYYQNVHTINECLHSFCLSCLEQYWGDVVTDGNVIKSISVGTRSAPRNTRTKVRGCPTCSIVLGPQPYAHVICDHQLQSLTEKITHELNKLSETNSSSSSSGSSDSN